MKSALLNNGNIDTLYKIFIILVLSLVFILFSIPRFTFTRDFISNQSFTSLQILTIIIILIYSLYAILYFFNDSVMDYTYFFWLGIIFLLQLIIEK